jgi:hypothetical protein
MTIERNLHVHKSHIKNDLKKEEPIKEKMIPEPQIRTRSKSHEILKSYVNQSKPQKDEITATKKEIHGPKEKKVKEAAISSISDNPKQAEFGHKRTHAFFGPALSSTMHVSAPDVEDLTDEKSTLAFKRYASVNSVQGHHLKKTGDALLSKFSACKTPEEVDSFYDTHKEELEKFETKVNAFNQNLNDIASKLKTKEGAPSTPKEISARYKAMKAPEKDTETFKADLFQYESYGIITESYKTYFQLIKILDEIKPKVKIADQEVPALKLEDESQCQSFLPFVKQLHHDSEQLKNHALNLTIDFQSHLTTQAKQGKEVDFDKTQKNKTATTKLRNECDKMEARLMEVISQIRTHGKNIDFKKMFKKLDHNKFNPIQTKIVTFIKESIRWISECKTVLFEVENQRHGLDVYNKANEINIRFLDRLHQLIDMNESNETILNDDELQSIEVEHANLMNQYSFDEHTQIVADMAKEITHMDQKETLLKKIKGSSMGKEATLEGSKNKIKQELARALKSNLKLLEADEANNQAKIEALEQRIHDLVGE